MKTYEAHQDYWYYSACDCCDATPMEFWEVLDEKGQPMQLNGTPTNLESLYEAILELHDIHVILKHSEPV